MKLQELAVISPTKQAAAVFESYFGTSIKFDTLSQRQAQSLLTRVRSLISEHRRTPQFHKSEQNPAYLKLVMLEQALATQAVAPQQTAQANPQQQAALQATQIQQARKQLQDQLKAALQQVANIQKQIANPAMAMAENRRMRRKLKESEVQQAQVVLASQDMVDQVQKMLEQVSAMQFKDLPALVDQVKNQIGVDQAMQFNTDASAALTGMIQNLQASKAQLETALGVVTGQAPVVPGDDMGAEIPATDEPPAELPAPDGDIDAEMDANLGAPQASLGRGRR